MAWAASTLSTGRMCWVPVANSTVERRKIAGTCDLVFELGAASFRFGAWSRVVCR